MAKLTNLQLEEFSIVRGSDVQPANPGARALRYKAQPTEEDSMSKAVQQDAPATEKKKSLAGRLADSISEVLKANSTRTVVSQSNSSWTETCQDDTAPMADGGEGGSTTIVITDAVTKAETTQQPAAATEDSSDSIVKAVTAGMQPLLKAVQGIDTRLTAVEKASTGSRQVKSYPAAQDITDQRTKGFPGFTKYLTEFSNLSPGQKLSKTTLSSSGWSYGLSFQEAQNFIDYIVDQSVLLKQIRTVSMPNVTYNIDKIGLGGKVLVKGTPGTDPGDTVSVSNPTQVQLSAKEVVGIVSVGDDTLEDNIEGDAFMQHLLGMIARAAANELEEAAIHGDTTVANSYILDRWDGYYKLAKANGAHVIEGMADTDRYWPGSNGAKATKVMKSVPTKYRQDLRNLGWILNSDVYLDYNDELASKGYANAWSSITGIQDLPLRGVKNVQVPLLSTSMSFTYSATPYTNGTFVMITDLRNLIFGIHREMKIEPYRQPRKRATDYVISMRADAKIENGDAIGIYDHALVKP